MPQITRPVPVVLLASLGSVPPEVDEGSPSKQGPRDWLCQTAGAAAPSGGSEPHAVGSVGAQLLSLARASCTCTPRLLPSNSCHSSTTTIRTPPRTSFASARASRRDRLSGVVTSTVGSRWFCALRSAEAVSPLRAPAL